MQKRAHVDGSYDLDEQFEPKSKKHKYPLTDEEQLLFKVTILISCLKLIGENDVLTC
jgi:hypothetical protein